MANKKGTVTISIEDYDNLCNGFDASEERAVLEEGNDQLRKMLKEKDNEIQDVLKAKFVCSKKNWLVSDYYIIEDNTPLWIRKIFNKS